MITRIEAYNYRCFPQLSVDVGRYHVLAGANGAGKTTLLDIPVLLGDLLRANRAAGAFLGRREEGALAPRASRLAELIHNDQGDRIAFAVEAALPPEIHAALAAPGREAIPGPVPTRLRYELRLDVGPRTLDVADEYLFLFAATEDQVRFGERTDSAGTEKPRPVAPTAGYFSQGRPISGTNLHSQEWRPVLVREGRAPARFCYEVPVSATDLPPMKVPQNQLALGSAPADESLFPALRWFAELLRAGVLYYEPDWDLLRRPAPPGDTTQLRSDARNTPWLALALQQQQEQQPDQPRRFTRWVEHVQTALPQITDIRVVEREEDHHAYFAVCYQGGYEVTSSGLSDGTLRVLALTLPPYLAYLDSGDNGPVLPTVLVAEEPENGIHPQAIETVVTSLSSIYPAQVWLSTHSPIVLAQTEAAEVLATRLRNGTVEVIPGDEHPALVNWPGTLDLGTIFAAGVLS